MTTLHIKTFLHDEGSSTEDSETNKKKMKLEQEMGRQYRRMDKV